MATMLRVMSALNPSKLNSATNEQPVACNLKQWQKKVAVVKKLLYRYMGQKSGLKI